MTKVEMIDELVNDGKFDVGVLDNLTDEQVAGLYNELSESALTEVSRLMKPYWKSVEETA